MKLLIKVSKFSLYCYLIILFAAISTTAYAQDIVDTSSSQDLLVDPTIVVTSSTIKPDCHSYTGCGVMVVKKHHTTHHSKPKKHRPRHEPCYIIETCCPRPIVEFIY